MNQRVSESASRRVLPWLVDEAKTRTLSSIPLRRVHQAQQAALMRLQLYATGKTHDILADFASKAKGTLMRLGSDKGLDTAQAFLAQTAIINDWQTVFMETWLPAMQTARREAASIPFGTLAVYQEKFLKPQISKAANLQEQEGANPVFEPQLQAIIDAATQHIYADGMNLSTRIWRLDRETRQGIQRTLMAGVQESKSAWQIAQDLEQFLGANRDCPRWTSTRLYRLPKTEIAAGNRLGLKSGSECDGQGVAYNALRLARTELQAVHHQATSNLMMAQPWVEQERIVISGAHPKADICDDIANGGPYAKGTIRLPLHPNCLCFAVAILQDEAAFTAGLRGWLNGGENAGMDQYATFLGVERGVGQVSLIDNVVALALQAWLFGGKKEIEARL